MLMGINIGLKNQTFVIEGHGVDLMGSLQKILDHYEHKFFSFCFALHNFVPILKFWFQIFVKIFVP